ncbi:hypothetical protein VN12_23605 [Pirellula sp. SH-Sr6A]|uniref:hypothetical protein n=1 Tax=Pirellula sp. SH-Sr6A TaxID=1632865 RepID=UPI00078DF153|nr:hypothetical protein [Pirellula sp. SH-Sr6A]AMV35132.1 hypothetical protein VN12_23605 [Pirellula sp. SH-Sr6A]
MRLLRFAIAIAPLLLSSAVYGQQKEPLTGGSPSDKKLVPGWARFEPNPAHQYIVARAREQEAHRVAVARYYESIGYDYAHPVLSSSQGMVPASLQFPRRNYVGPTFYASYHGVPVYSTIPFGSPWWSE